jgi:hypothetical protein
MHCCQQLSLWAHFFPQSIGFSFFSRESYGLNLTALLKVEEKDGAADSRICDNHVILFSLSALKQRVCSSAGGCEAKRYDLEDVRVCLARSKPSSEGIHTQNSCCLRQWLPGPFLRHSSKILSRRSEFTAMIASPHVLIFAVRRRFSR